MHLGQLAILAITAGGCGLAEEPAESTIQSALICSVLDCGSNAPTIGDGLLFDELDLFGRPNYAGVAMTGANLASGTRVNILIWHDILYAVDPVTSAVYSGYDLLFTEIHFKHVPTGVTFDLRVDDYIPQSVTYMSGAREPVPVYDFKARRSPGGKFDFEVCNHDGLPVATEESWPGIPHHALVYRGDRYRHKTVIANSPSDGWSFIACNGGAGTKMHLWRHTYAGAFDAAGNPTYMTTLAERTTLLKAITADYCGAGGPEFTVFGTPLAFATAEEPASFPLPYTRAMSSIEALWGPSGATCIDRPRRERFGVTKPQVEKDCGHAFPSCAPGATVPPTDWFITSHVVTANP